MSRKILARTAISATVTEPADEVAQGPVGLDVRPLDDGNVSITIIDQDRNIVVFEADADVLVHAIGRT